jgi:hypothetical protein
MACIRVVGKIVEHFPAMQIILWNSLFMRLVEMDMTADKYCASGVV